MNTKTTGLEDGSRYLSPTQAAKYLGISRTSFFGLVKEGRTSSGKRGIWPVYLISPRQLRVRADSLDDFAESRRYDRIMPA
jgi:hypothetical protein